MISSQVKVSQGISLLHEIEGCFDIPSRTGDLGGPHDMPRAVDGTGGFSFEHFQSEFRHQRRPLKVPFIEGDLRFQLEETTPPKRRAPESLQKGPSQANVGSSINEIAQGARDVTCPEQKFGFRQAPAGESRLLNE